MNCVRPRANGHIHGIERAFAHGEFQRKQERTAFLRAELDEAAALRVAATSEWRFSAAEPDALLPAILDKAFKGAL